MRAGSPAVLLLGGFHFWPLNLSPSRAESNKISHTWLMARVQPPWAPPLVELSVGVTGHLLCWEKVEADGSWWAWVSWVHESGGRVHHKVVQVRADTLRPLEPPGAYKDVPRRVRGLDGQIRMPTNPAVPGFGQPRTWSRCRIT
jgi:hypothetical protein